MHLICPPHFCISIVFNFSWDGPNNQEKYKTKVMQNFGRQIRRIMGNVEVTYERDDEVGWGGERVFSYVSGKLPTYPSPNPHFALSKN